MSAKKTTTRTPSKRSTTTTRSRKSASRSGRGGAEKNKGMAIVAYIIFFIPLITGDHKRSQFVRFHTNQGTVLFLATIAFSIAHTILIVLLGAIFRGIGAWRILGLFGTLFGLLWIVPFIFFILGIINAANGQMKKLPIIGGFTIIK